MNSDPRASIDEGAVIGGKYRVEGTLGEGGMGVVVSAVHLDLDRRVAIKVIRQELQGGDEIAKRMLVEARNASSITSEHVVRVLDLGRLESGAPYIVMEQLEGQNLYELVQQRGPLSPLEAVDYVLEACEAVAEAHSRGIVHRDLKPENLFLATRADGTPCIKVLDFGVSKHTGSGLRDGAMALTNPSVAVGSPHYMAPEQMRARGNVDGRADIYSLGAILFEILTGSPPFDADNIPALCTMVLTHPAPNPASLRSDLPPELDALIHRCLAKNPDERFWSVAELAKALLPFGSDAAALSVERITRLLGDAPPPVSRRVPPMHERREARTLELETPPEGAPNAEAATTLEAPTPRGRRVALGVFGAVAVMALAAVALYVMRPETSRLARALPDTRAVVDAVRISAPVRVEPASSQIAVSDPVAPAVPNPSRPAAPRVTAPRVIKKSSIPTEFGGRK